MNIAKNNRLSLILCTLHILVLMIGPLESWSTELSADSQQDQPFWQFVLRELLFRTMSNSLSNDILYEKLLGAPFYGDPLPKVSHEMDALLSHGKIYLTPEDRWILCQDNCHRCQYCARQRNPKFVWSLKRIKRGTRSPKWDLQLTLMPKFAKDASSSLTHAWPIAERTRQEESKDIKEMTSMSTDRSLVIGGSNDEGQLTEVDDSTVRKEHPGNKSSARRRNKDLKRIKRYRSRVRPIGKPGPLSFYYPQEDQQGTNDDKIARLRDTIDPQLIIGIDQQGNKHLVHIIPVDLPFLDPTGSAEYPLRRTHRRNPSQEDIIYEKLIDRIFESLDSQRHIIEAFLFSERLEPKTLEESPGGIIGKYDSSIGDDINQRFLDSGGTNPVHLEDQIRDNRHYGNMGREVNIPTGVYQDQSSMIEYEAPGTSANDQRHQDERSLPRAEAERTRRDSLRKLTDASSADVGHQAPSERNVEMNITDDALLNIARKYENPSNFAPGNSRLKINQSDRFENSTMLSTNVKLETGESVDSR